MINTRKAIDYWEASRTGFITNYPNFLHWKRMNADAVADSGPLNIYLHTPYCIQRCSYCYYKTVNLRGSEKQQRMNRYVDALCREIELAARVHHLGERKTHSVYMGGGTPTLLTDDQIRRIVDSLRSHLQMDQAEFTVEAEPVTLTQEKADTLAALGVNRVSMGVQSFHDEIIKQSHRLDSEKKALRAIDIAKTIGATINIDLMSGLAGETPETWEYSVERAIATEVDSITVYKTELYANTQYYQDLRKKTIELPSDEQELAYMQHALDRLQQAGYAPWSFYTFTRNGAHPHVHASSNFRGDDCYSFGVSAFGRMADYLFQNTNDEENYIESVLSGQLPIQRGHHLSSLDAMIRYLVLCMKMVTLDLPEFQQKYGFKLESLCASAIEQLESDGYLTASDDALRLTTKGMLHGDYAGKMLAKQLMTHY